MAQSPIDELRILVAKLQQERTQHLAAIAEIDEVFERFGVTAAKPKKRGRRPGRPKKKAAGVRGAPQKRRKRGTFKTTASELILAAIRKAGAKGASGAQLSEAWKAAGRSGDAYNTLTLLAKDKKIKRHEVKGERGSRYTVA